MLLSYCRLIVVCVVLSVVISAPLPGVQRTHGDHHPFCKLCRRFAEKVVDTIQSKKAYADIRNDTIRLCTEAMDVDGLKGHVICPGLMDTYIPPILYIVSEALFSPNEICQKLDFCPPTNEHQGHVNNQLNHMITDISDAAQRHDNTQHGKLDHQQPIRILQLTDIHLDHQYKSGTPVDCGLFICCQEGMNGSGRAGQYGDYKCDLPIATLNLLTNHLKQLNPQPDFIVYTGDNPPHDIWEESWQSQTNSTNFLVKYLSTKLPNQTIYPAMGNHETFPESFYYPPRYRNLTDALAEFWQRWVELPENALQTIRAGGFYTMLIRPGLRLMSINTDFGYRLNFYTLLNDQTPEFFNQQKWMEETLAMAAEKGEKVIIIGHIPPGIADTIKSYGDFYVPVVAKYRDIIVGQLFGHTHEDQFEVVHVNSKPAGVVNVAPSVTPRTDINPSYRIYLMDPTTFRLIDYEQYHINLTEVNLLAEQNRIDEIKWKLAYTAREEYDLPDFTPNSWWNLTERFQHNSSLLFQYWNNKFARSDVHRHCGWLCKQDLICLTQSASKTQYNECLFMFDTSL